MEIKEYLSRKGIQIKKTRGSELIINCPFCGDKEYKGAVNSQSGAYHCLHANRCGVSSSWFDFQKKLGDTPQTLPVWKHAASSFIPPQKKKYTTPTPKIKKLSSGLLQHLKERGFSEKTIEYFKIGEKDNAMAYPYFKDGKLTGVKYITTEKKMWGEANSEPVLFNRDNIDLSEDVLTICEGENDCMALYEYGIKAVSVPNGSKDFRWVDNEWEWLQQFDEFYICLDNDTAGNEGAQVLAQKLGAWKCSRAILPHKDANECLQNGIQADEIIERIGSGVDFKPNELATPDLFANEIIQLIENPQFLNGTPTAWDKLTEVLGGWRKSELTIWSGQSGAGKSTVLNQQILGFIGKGVGVCMASLEMTPARYLRWMLLQHTHKQFPRPVEVREALAGMSDNLYIINSTDVMDIDVLLDMFKYAARRYNVQHFVIDSLMRINVTGADKWDSQKEFITKLLTFAKKFQAHVHLVAHARKLTTDEDRPDKTSVKGSGDITDLAHNVLTVWRVPETSRIESDTVLTVQKNREVGTLGHVGLFFDPKAKLFCDSNF